MNYYISPLLNKTDCPQGEHCFTLSGYAKSSSQTSNQERNVSLLLLDGVHVLTQNFTILNLERLIIRPFEPNGTITIDVSCQRHFSFKNISFLTLVNLAFQGCQEPPFSTVTVIANIASLVRVKFNNCVPILLGRTVNVSHSQFLNSTIDICAPKYEEELLYYEPQNTLTFTNSNITNSPIERCATMSFGLREFRHDLNIIGCVIENVSPNFALKISTAGPGACFQIRISKTYYHGGIDVLLLEEANNVTLRIDQSILKGSNEHVVLVGTIGGGYNNIAVTIISSTITEGRGNGISIVLIDSFPDYALVTVRNCTIYNNRIGSEIFVTRKVPDGISDQKTNLTVSYLDTIFSFSEKIAIQGDIPMNMALALDLTIINCTFIDNSRVLDIAKARKILDTTQSNTVEIILSVVSVQFKLTQIKNNNYYLLQYFDSALVELSNINSLRLEDCTILNNKQTAVRSYFSGVTLSGTTTFSNNTGIKGGALSLYHSQLYIEEYSQIYFIDNFAEDLGGGIYLVDRTPSPWSSEFKKNICFFQIRKSILSKKIDWWPENFSIIFMNNKASNGGDDIYGGRWQSVCKSFTNRHLIIKKSITTIFHFNNRSISSISSDPKRVCLCSTEGNPECSDINYIFSSIESLYPGEKFTISLVLVGYNFGTVNGIVYTNLIGKDNNTSLGPNQYLQEIREHRECTELEFWIQSLSTNFPLTLQLGVQKRFATEERSKVEKSIATFNEKHKLEDLLLYHPVIINTVIEDCPTGMALSTIPPFVCKCHPKLELFGVRNCFIINHTSQVYRSNTIWISAAYRVNASSGFVVHPYCPYDYCNSANISINPEFPDEQCLFGHSGVLCGGCGENLSLALGTTRCLSESVCDNNYVSLVIVFVLAGILLVFFIKLFELTVTKCTLNGLILYANIVWANKSIYFLNEDTIHPALQTLHIFLAWINLDFGIETCFIAGLNAYWKTWLQFVFPLYVWSITGVVIIASHYSTRASKIFGNNSVPVLATLILLSYAKLLRTIIISLGFSLLDYPQGTRIVWSFDGNVPYFGAAHTILFLVAIAALILLWLPYIIILFTLQWLRRKSYLKPLQWINKLKPFFDAYFGQLKPKHQYWVGLLLFVRMLLFVLFAVTHAVVPKVNVVAVGIVATILLVYQVYSGSVYKSTYLSLLENSFIVNLALLGLATLYMDNLKMPNTPVIYTSVSIAFIEFLAIVIYHAWSRLRSIYMTYKRRHANRDNADNPADRPLKVVARVPHKRMHYREPLLDSLIEGQ